MPRIRLVHETEVLQLKTRLFPNRADQDFYRKFVQSAGGLDNAERRKRMVNHDIEPLGTGCNLVERSTPRKQPPSVQARSHKTTHKSSSRHNLGHKQAATNPQAR